MNTFLEFVNSKDIDKEKLYDIDNYYVYLVNASKIRDISQENDEFNHFATHWEFPKLIPNKEIWISKDIKQKEIPFLVHNGINQYEGKRKGIKDWYNYAIKKEEKERKIKDGNHRKHSIPSKIYKKYYCKIDEMNVWLVDGEMVRNNLFVNFVEGGNPFVYKWIPKNEIWIENNLSESEINITILHEYVESMLMKIKKFSYNKAHYIASKVDWHHRNNWTIKDIRSLTPEKALKIASKYYR